MLGQAACTICTDAYSVDTERSIAAMPCGHTFHDSCLERWLCNTRSCPSCRKTLRKNQAPIHRLFFDCEANLTQLESAASPNKSAGEIRKLKQQLCALNQAIEKLKVELEQEQAKCKKMVADHLGALQEQTRTLEEATRLRERIKLYKNQQEKMEQMRVELSYLKNVKILVDGLESDKDRVLHAHAGYTPRQMVYVSLLRKQVEQSKESSNKLRQDLAVKTAEHSKTRRLNQGLKEELESLKCELKHQEEKSENLNKKIEVLVRSIESPSGVSSSLAQRLIFQSPAPKFFSPFQANKPQSETEQIISPAGSGRPESTSTPSERICKNSDVLAEDSLVTSAPNSLAAQLNFSDDTEELVEGLMQAQAGPGTSPLGALKLEPPAAKKMKYVRSKAALTQASQSSEAKVSPFSAAAMTLKHKSFHAFKAKSLNKPPGMVDCTNTLGSTSRSNANRPKFEGLSRFRKGFDGLGGQTTTYTSGEQIKLSIFKKPIHRPNSKSTKNLTLPGNKKLTEFIVLD